MNHNLLEKVPVILEPHLTLPNGARASRCQRIKKNGSQCANPSRSGFSICSKHGAGYAAREKTEDAKPTGRPPIHGLYSKTGITNIHQLADEVQALNLNLDDTDYELRTLKATLWYLLEQGPKFARHVDTFEQLAEQLERKAAGEAGPMDPAEARMIAQTVQQLHRLSTSLGSWTDRVTDGGMKVIHAVKARADTKVKLAETRALSEFMKLAKGVRDIVWDLLDDEQLDVFEDRLRREVLGPKKLELPKKEEN